MEESTRIIVAYALLIIGIPLLIARLIWFIPGVILNKAISNIVQGIDHILDAAVEGFIAILLACVVFDWLNLQIPAGVPIILFIISSLWGWAKGSAYKVWSSALGITAGFILYRHVMLLLANEFGLHV